jgi:trimeric autotransporter adhesin
LTRISKGLILINVRSLKLQVVLVLGALLLLSTPAEALAVVQSINSASQQDQTITGDTNVTFTTNTANGSHSLGWSGLLPISRGGTNANSFTSGSVLFYNGTSFAQNNGNLFWDNTNSRLGIGSSSPTTALDVTTDITINSIKFGRGASSFDNIAIGANTLLNDTVGTRNIAIGSNTLRAITSSSDSTAVGHSALGNNTNSGEQNTAVGSQTLQANTSGSQNTGLGFSVLQFNTTGGSNAGLGAKALRFNTTGNRNVAFGVDALANNTTGSSNIAFGNESGAYQSDGSTALTTASNSIYIGDAAIGYDNNDSNSIVLGYNTVGAGVNKTVIGNQNMTDAYFGSSSANANTHAKKAYLGSSSTPGCIIMGDTDGSGVSYITVNDGVMSVSSSPPSACQ